LSSLQTATAYYPQWNPATTTNLSYIKLIRKPINSRALFYVDIFIVAFLRAEQAHIPVYMMLTVMKLFTKVVLNTFHA
jgi:hypothetical protein